MDRAPSRRFWRWVVAMTVGVMLLAIVFRVGIESMLAFDAGELALANKDREAAVFHFRSAARWYFPGNPWVGSALDRLSMIAHTATLEKDWVFAVHVYDSARAAILGTRSFYTPNKQRLEDINRVLPDVLWNARLVHANGPRPLPTDEAPLKEFFARRLEVNHAPNMAWSVVMCLGFVVWIAGTFLAVWHHSGAGAATLKPQWLRFAGMAFGGFALWFGSLFAL